MRVLLTRRGLYAAGQNGLGFDLAFLLNEHLRVHQVSRNVVGMLFQQDAKVLVRGSAIPSFYAFKGQAIARKCIIGILLKELFEFFAAVFVLVGHGGVSYYTVDQNSGQRDDGKRRDEESGTQKRK